MKFNKSAINYWSNLNLSRNRFHNRKLFWVSWALCAICLTLITGKGVQDLRNEQAREQDRIRQNSNQQKKLETIRTKTNPLVTKLSPEQDKTIQSILFLTQKKIFLWSNMLAQLEQELPREVRVVQIDCDKKDQQVQVTSTELPIVLTLCAQKPELLTKVILSMNKHGVFHFEPTSQHRLQETDPTANSNEVVFVLEGKYNSLAPKIENVLEVAKNRNSNDQ